MRFLRRWLLLSIAAPLLGIVLVVVFVMGISWLPWGTAPASVRHGSGCPVASNDTSVEGPADRSPDEAADYPPGHEWALLDRDPDSLPGHWLGDAYGAERWLKSRLPWSVRFRIEWDSEASMVAAYGSHDDICMLARLVASARS